MTNSPTLKSRVSLLRTAAVGAIVSLAAVTLLTGPATRAEATTKHTTTTISPHRTATAAQAAATASLSVVRAAMYLTKTATTPVRASNITAAAKPDGKTVVILHNLGSIQGHANIVTFAWHLGKAPIINCVKVPTTRDAFPTTVKKEAKLIVACPAGAH